MSPHRTTLCSLGPLTSTVASHVANARSLLVATKRTILPCRPLQKPPTPKQTSTLATLATFFGEVKSEVESEAVQVTNEEKEGKSDTSATQNENDEAPTPKPTPIMQHDPTMAAFEAFEAFEWTVPNEESFEWDFGGFNSFDWGRKRRSPNLSQAELLKAALENIVSGLSYTSPKFNRLRD